MHVVHENARKWHDLRAEEQEEVRVLVRSDPAHRGVTVEDEVWIQKMVGGEGAWFRLSEFPPEGFLK
jgi:hypothetical protein